MTPRSELIFDFEMRVNPEMGAVCAVGEKFLCGGHLQGYWSGTIEWMGDGDCIVLVSDAPATMIVKPGHRVLVAWG